MPACPSCGAEISGGGACSRCGAKAPALDVPDLDLSSVSGPMSAPQPPVRRTSGAMAAVMTNDDPLAADAGEASFELAVGPGDIGMPPGLSSGVSKPPGSLPNPSFDPGPLSNPPTSGGSGHSTGSVPRVSGPPHDPSTSDALVSRPPGPPVAPRVDPLEAAAFADYGAPPLGLLQSPVYAFRVKMRQSELRRGLWRAKIAFERAQKEQAKALADPSRLDEVKARLASDVEAKERDVDVHEAALNAFDAKSVQRGTTIALTAAAFLFLMIFVPVFLRMCVGVDAPPLTPSSQ